MKLPKQWKYWIRKHCGYTFARTDYKAHWTEEVTCHKYGKFTHYFRILPQENGWWLMQIDDGNMDRWANSVGCSVQLPKDFKEVDFVAARQCLLDNVKIDSLTPVYLDDTAARKKYHKPYGFRIVDDFAEDSGREILIIWGRHVSPKYAIPEFEEWYKAWQISCVPVIAPEDVIHQSWIEVGKDHYRTAKKNSKHKIPVTFIRV